MCSLIVGCIPTAWMCDIQTFNIQYCFKNRSSNKANLAERHHKPLRLHNQIWSSFSSSSTVSFFNLEPHLRLSHIQACRPIAKLSRLSMAHFFFDFLYTRILYFLVQLQQSIRCRIRAVWLGSFVVDSHGFTDECRGHHLFERSWTWTWRRIVDVDGDRVHMYGR